jgi:hypothetical protein
MPAAAAAEVGTDIPGINAADGKEITYLKHAARMTPPRTGKMLLGSGRPRTASLPENIGAMAAAQQRVRMGKRGRKPGPRPKACPWCPPNSGRCNHCHCLGYDGCSHPPGQMCSRARYKRRLVCNPCEKHKLKFSRLKKAVVGARTQAESLSAAETPMQVSVPRQRALSCPVPGTEELGGGVGIKNRPQERKPLVAGLARASAEGVTKGDLGASPRSTSVQKRMTMTTLVKLERSPRGALAPGPCTGEGSPPPLSSVSSSSSLASLAGSAPSSTVSTPATEKSLSRGHSTAWDMFTSVVCSLEKVSQ